MQSDFSAGFDLMEYPAYRQSFEVIEEIKGMLRAKYGDAQWIDEWYLYA